MITVESSYIETNGVKLHVAQKGPKDGKLVLLLHGFPEFWYGWHKQIEQLAALGYRVWAPDQRGYNFSSKPKNVRDYQISHLTKDVAGLIKASGRDKVILVGHDWGGIVAWRTAREYPELLEKFIVLNAPHEAVMRGEVKSNPVQVLRSTYAGFFQIPKLPEKLLASGDWQPLLIMLKATSQKGTFTDEDLERYRRAWSTPNAMTSMLNWYRAVKYALTDSKLPSQVTVPSMLIWGEKDQFLGKELAHKSIELCSRRRLVFFEKATHWIHLEEAEHITELIHQFAENEEFLENKLLGLS